MNNKETVTMRFRDNVFCMLFRDKKNLLELYNALNDTDYTNVDDLAVTTLQGGVYMKYKNVINRRFPCKFLYLPIIR